MASGSMLACLLLTGIWVCVAQPWKENKGVRALLSFQNSLGNFRERVNWTITEDPCNWTGVVCLNKSLAEYPVLLNLSMNEVFTSKEQLSCGTWSSTCEPRILAVNSNCSGTCSYMNMTMEIGGLTFLQALQLQAVGFSGNISRSLSNLTGLLYLDLSGNSLVHDIDVLSSFTKLWGLNFSGIIPDESFGGQPPFLAIEAQATLRHIDYSNNNYEGDAIFGFLKNLTAIVHANLSRNFLSGGRFEEDLRKIGSRSKRPCPGSNCVGFLDLSTNLFSGFDMGPIPQEAFKTLMVNNSFRIFMSDCGLRGLPPTALLAAIPEANKALMSRGGVPLPKPSDWLDFSNNYFVGNVTSADFAGIFVNNCLTRPNCKQNCFLPGQRNRADCEGSFPNVTFPPDVPPPVPPGKGDTSLLVGLLVGGSVLFLIVVTSVALLVTWMAKRRLPLTLSETRSMKLFTDPSSGLPMEFSYQEVLAMTDNLSNDRFISFGGFGRVYRGTIKLKGKDMPESSIDVAIKVLNVDSLHEAEETQLQTYKNEVETIGRAHHRNLVRLLGFCTDEGKRILVLEFVENGDLQSQLHGSRKGSALTWDARMRVARGCARALRYLHEECNPRIIHRDIKPSNILLDNNLEPKISDFGLARILPADKLELTTKAGGTLGYMDYALATTAKLTDKSDVYSFGLVLLELVTGKSPRFLVCDDKHLVSWIWERREDGRWAEMADPVMGGHFDMAELQSVVNVALTCVLDDFKASSPIRFFAFFSFRCLDFLTLLWDRSAAADFLGGSCCYPASALKEPLFALADLVAILEVASASSNQVNLLEKSHKDSELIKLKYASR